MTERKERERRKKILKNVFIVIFITSTAAAVDAAAVAH
jgi:hypothetical protein